MFNNVTISKKLMLGIAGVSFFGLLSGIVGVLMLLTVERQINEITDYAFPVSETTDELIYAVSQAHRVSVEILYDNDRDNITRREAEFDDALAHFDREYAVLNDLLTNPVMRQSLEQAVGLRTELLASVDVMVAAHMEELAEADEARRLMLHFDQVGDQLISMLGELADANEMEMQIAEDEGDRLAASSLATVAQVNDLIGLIFEQDYPAVEASKDLQILVEQLEGTAPTFLTQTNDQELAATRETFAALVAQGAAHFDRLMEIAETAEDVAAIQ